MTNDYVIELIVKFETFSPELQTLLKESYVSSKTEISFTSKWMGLKSARRNINYDILQYIKCILSLSPPEILQIATEWQH